MDSERFDRWAKLLALRMSRRTAAAVGAATVVSLASPKWVLGQDDDDDQDDDDQNTDDQGDDNGDDDLDQHKDNPTGENPDSGDLGKGVCLDIVSCKREHCNSGVNIDGSGECHYDTIGDIPGGPYEQEWVWANLPDACTPIGHTWRELEALCNQAYPGDEGLHACNDECEACTSFSFFLCH